MADRPMLPMPVVLVVIQATALYFALTPLTLGAGSPLRIVTGGAVAFLLPGALASAALGARSRHVLETIAVSTFGSVAIIASLALSAMALQAPPGAVIASLFALNLALTLACLRRPRSLRFLTPRWRGLEDALLLVVLAGLSTMAYRWADDVKAVGWELSLHLGYVRQYASPLPLGFDTAALRPPEAIAQNYLYLWEFVLAVASRISGVDPLVAALKSRWLMPLLGFASFFFMVQRLTASTRAALRVTWVMLAALLAQFLALPPNPYETFVEANPLRQVGAFLSSIHHSDSAMEVLLPILIGCLFWALRTGTIRAFAALAGALVIAFLWHPREYFQVMWYGVVAALVDMAAGLAGGRGAWKRRWTRYALMAACYVGIAGVLLLAMPASIRGSSEHGAGLAAQREAIGQFLAGALDLGSWVVISAPFGFHLHGLEIAGLPKGPPMTFSWLVLGVLLAAALPFSTNRRIKWLGLYLVVVWFTGLCSLKSEQLLQALTYEEMLISKPRLVHLFAYAVIGLGWSGLIGRAGSTRQGAFSRIRAFVFALLGGSAFALAWKASGPDFRALFAVLNVLFFLVAGLLILSLRGRFKASLSASFTQPTPMIAALTFLVFAAPASGATLGARWKVMLERNVTPLSLFGPANPLGLDPETLVYFQTVHPPRQRLLVEPNQPHMVGIYAPVYVMPLLGNVGADMEQLQQGRQGRHPVYNRAMLNGAPDLGSIRSFLDEKRIVHLLGAGPFAGAFVDLAARNPAEFAVRFASRDGSNVVIEYLEALKNR